MKQLLICAIALVMAGCSTLKNPDDTNNVVDYSVAQHGLFVDEIIPIFKLTGVHTGNGYKFYYDTANQLTWHKEYAQYCRLAGGMVQTYSRTREPSTCMKDGKVMFTWLSTSTTLSHIGYGGKQVVDAHKKYFLVLMPTTREMDRSEAESKTKNYYKQLVKMK